jgi:hypothetical protein
MHLLYNSKDAKLNRIDTSLSVVSLNFTVSYHLTWMHTVSSFRYEYYALLIRKYVVSPDTVQNITPRDTSDGPSVV